MNAREITRALAGTWHGKYGMACCPAHGDRSPSLSIRDGENGQLLLHCFAGCAYETVRQALKDLGLVEEHWTHLTAKQPIFPARQTKAFKNSSEDTARSEWPLAIWAASTSATGTPVETYLASRGLALLSGDMLRFHPGLKHPSGGYWPAMVALITRGADGQPRGIHRTFLARDGAGKAPVSPDKMMLGPSRGGAVRLSEAGPQLMVGEGLETCLSAMQVMGGAPTWAALSTSGLRSLDLPPDVQEVVILADADEAGETAAKAAALRWRGEGRRARIARPPSGQDFNDLLRTTPTPPQETC